MACNTTHGSLMRARSSRSSHALASDVVAAAFTRYYTVLALWARGAGRTIGWVVLSLSYRERRAIYITVTA